MVTNIVKKIKSAVKEPGIYIFYKGRTPLYIGKASNLKNRLQSYLKIIDIKTESLHQEANKLKIVKLRSNIEALIVESKLIKELKPRYNILWRDDKNYFYVAVTKEKFPRIFITHQPLKIPNYKNQITNKIQKSKYQNNKLCNLGFGAWDLDYIGPFTEGQSLKAVLRLLRKFFPYCSHKPHFRICLDAQINNCPGYCCQKNDQQPTTNDKQLIKDYKKNITKIKNILTGKDKNFIRQLKDPYELLVLEKIWQHEPYLNQRITNQSRINEFVNSKQIRYSLIETLTKVECYDNSHLSGKEAVGAMTAWRRLTTAACGEPRFWRDDLRQTTKWVANKNMWRKFKIRGNYTEDDPRMMGEIISRRLNHPEWPYPNLIIIDGGITQLRAAQRASNQRITNQSRINEFVNSKPIRNSLMKLKIISFAKPQELVFGLEKNPVSISKLPPEFQKLIKTAIQNTHNFVIRYHRKTREKKFIK